MIQKISVPVSVDLSFNHHTRTVLPVRLIFEGRNHLIRRIGFHHVYREGRTLYHVFSVASDTLFFRLVLNTDNLHWQLEEISDGEVV
ncbi:MAG: hypothetical protein UX91_C0006G0065 [Candidatus Amesbacteria bacterium GW2011_GWB1_47_19]|nr:MAG: hypothetical protein UW51_C0002G0065 [Candidatus Amesbacteria bacterium GW2011_GWA1_44_24]KKU31344.1 MAG: hypothetical protein UX46_C0006G0136 [Candidatus Amesbacteria bacterium GW2011_GWC1_46_24]KKU67003.1 MAG: hypothetical protein UX91_C0006G0065 [Candidatus Amesbacteria bacterium GW2011_GWB1_47_19]OGD04835.1 MAG: hypothetical protein A2379_04695 [Candidatus Amesbacteria bacterium RIFOXYB1_FULL_47_13]HBC72777.1 hypothetical protein [Candidatus Amesbacteria bacterium]